MVPSRNKVSLSSLSFFLDRADPGEHKRLLSHYRGGITLPDWNDSYVPTPRERKAIRRREMQAREPKPSGNGLLWIHPGSGHELLPIECFYITLDKTVPPPKKNESSPEQQKIRYHKEIAKFVEDIEDNIALGHQKEALPLIQAAYIHSALFKYHFEMSLFLMLEVRLRDWLCIKADPMSFFQRLWAPGIVESCFRHEYIHLQKQLNPSSYNKHHLTVKDQTDFMHFVLDQIWDEVEYNLRTIRWLMVEATSRHRQAGPLSSALVVEARPTFDRRATVSAAAKPYTEGTS